jgi:hypothetical protein
VQHARLVNTVSLAIPDAVDLVPIQSSFSPP